MAGLFNRAIEITASPVWKPIGITSDVLLHVRNFTHATSERRELHCTFLIGD